MIPENFKTALNIAYKQLPDFIRDNESYAKFVSFLEAYYDWMAENGNIEERTKNILNYKDIDNTLSEFEQYFYNEFLTYFPETTLANKRELVKLSKEFYRRKSTRSAFKFLFRSLYNTDCYLYNTRESILIASDGKWVKSTFLELDSFDVRFLRVKNLKVFGERTKSFAKIENARINKNRKIQLQISDVYRNFNSGEYIRIVDNDFNDVYFDSEGNIVTSETGELLRGVLVGNISSVDVDPANPGLGYAIGDPVVFFGGYNENLEDSIEAAAEVSDVTVGKINQITVVDGSNGFRLYPNSEINISGTYGGAAYISNVDISIPATVEFWGLETISPYSSTLINAASYGFTTNPTANANTKLKDAFSNVNFLTYPISSVVLTNPGSGYPTKPTVTAESYFTNDGDSFNVKDLGILSPIKIDFGGSNYSNGDVVVISGGTGIGAYANVKLVNSNGTIQSIQYIRNANNFFPLGGMGYSLPDLPTVSIVSANNKKFSVIANGNFATSQTTIKLKSTANVQPGMYISGNGVANVISFNYFNSNTTILSVNTSSNTIVLSNPLNANVSNNSVYVVDGTAITRISSILGEGEQFSVDFEELGKVKSINVTNSGQNYFAKPNTSLRVVDVVVSRTDDPSIIPQKGLRTFQSPTELYSSKNFLAYFHSIEVIDDGYNDKYILRLYDYSGLIYSNPTDFVNPVTPIFVVDNNTNKLFEFSIVTNYNNTPFSMGVNYFGNGGAKANAVFSSATTYGKGKYLNSDGFLSSDKVLENEIYNEFSYFLTAEKEFKKYRDIAYNILHPGGTKLIGRNSIRSYENEIINSSSNYDRAIELKYVLSSNVYGTLISENILEIGNNSTSLSNVIEIDSYISTTSTYDESFRSQVSGIDDANNYIYLQDYKILNFGNVAYGYTSTNTVHITSLTGKFDLINNGNYSNTNNKLVDIVFPGDFVTIGDNELIEITNIDYTVNNWILYSGSSLSNTSNSLVSIKRNYVANRIEIEYTAP